MQDKGFESEITDSLKGMVGFFFLSKMHFGEKRRRNILAASHPAAEKNVGRKAASASRCNGTMVV